MGNSLVDDHLELFKSGEFSDVEIICQGRVFKAHKLILSTRSPYFKAALNSSWTESLSVQVRVDKVDPDAMELILPEYIYIGDFDKIRSRYRNLGSGSDDFTTCVLLFVCGDFLPLTKLANDARHHLDENLRQVLYKLWTFERVGNETPKLHDPLYQKDDNVARVVTELATAVKAAYAHPTARDIQKLLLVISMGLRDHMPEKTFLSLAEEVPAFKADAAALLLSLQFKKTASYYEPPVREQLRDRARRPSDAGYPPCSLHDCPDLEENEKDSHEPPFVMVDPFIGDGGLWCPLCRQLGLECRMDELVLRLLK